MSLFKSTAVGMVMFGICALGFPSSGLVKAVRGADGGASSGGGNLGDLATPAELGVDIYPGARQRDRAVRMQLKEEHFVTVKFITPDSLDKVLAFYKAKLGPQTETSSHMGNTIVSRGKKWSKDSILVTIVPNSRVDNGATQITVLHTVKN